MSAPGIYLKPYKLQLAGVLATVLVFTVSSLAFPRLMGMIIDRTTKPEGWSLIVPLLVVYVVLLIVRSIAQLSRNYLIQRVGMRGDVRFARRGLFAFAEAVPPVL